MHPQERAYPNRSCDGLASGPAKGGGVNLVTEPWSKSPPHKIIMTSSHVDSVRQIKRTVYSTFTKTPLSKP